MADFDLLSDLAKEGTLEGVLAALGNLPTDQAVTAAQLQAVLAAVIQRTRDIRPVQRLAQAQEQDTEAGVLTFDLGGGADLIGVDVDPLDPEDQTVYICTVSVGAQTPSETLGIRCRSGVTSWIPITTATGEVKVWVPVGVSVSVGAGDGA